MRLYNNACNRDAGWQCATWKQRSTRPPPLLALLALGATPWFHCRRAGPALANTITATLQQETAAMEVGLIPGAAPRTLRDEAADQRTV